MVQKTCYLFLLNFIKDFKCNGCSAPVLPSIVVVFQVLFISIVCDTRSSQCAKLFYRRPLVPALQISLLLLSL